MSMSKYASHDQYLAAVKDASAPYVKPIVHYQAHPDEVIMVGDSANIIPVDHPAGYLNGRVAHTSGVVSVGPDGSFETRNTRYVLVKD